LKKGRWISTGSSRERFTISMTRTFKDLVLSPVPRTSWLLFLQNYLEACLLLTLSKGKLSWVNIGNVRRVKAMAADLLSYKEKYEIYLRCLENGKAALLQLRSPDTLPRRGPSLIPSAARLSAWQKIDKPAVGSN
jgi:hypothetical protein